MNPVVCINYHDRRVWEVRKLEERHPDGKEWADAILNGEGEQMSRDFCDLECSRRQLCNFYSRFGT